MSLEVLKRNLGTIVAITFVAVFAIGIWKGLFYAFETLPERVAFFGARFGK